MAAWASGTWASGTWATGAWVGGVGGSLECWATGAWVDGAWVDGCWGESDSPPEPPPSSTRTGGDDRIDRGHRGYGKRATLKRNRDHEFDAQVRDIYRALLGDPRTADEAQAIVAAVTKPVRVKGESEAAREAALMARAEAMRRRADAMDADAIQAEIALRLLHRNLMDMTDADDLDDIAHVLALVL